MSGKLKLVIADDEEFICQLLISIIDFEKLDMELIGSVNDGESLLNLINTSSPDIVITDICMPKLDGLDVIRQINESGKKCKFIVVSGYQQFEYAHNALRYDVEDYIVKPLDPDEINKVLTKTINDLRMANNLIPPTDYISTVRSQFLSTALPQISTEAVPLEQINWKNYTHFKDGLFRAVSVKLDYTNRAMQEHENIFSVLKKLSDLTIQNFEPICYDVICEQKSAGIMAIINYAHAKENEILDSIDILFKQAKNIINLFRGFTLTVCSTDSFEDIHYGSKAMDELRTASFSRLYEGTNRIIFYTESLYDKKALDKILTVTGDALKKDFSILDINSFNQHMKSIFSLPSAAICSCNTVVFLRKIRKQAFEISDSLADGLIDSDTIWQLYRDTSFSLHHCTNPIDYQNQYISQISKCMSLVSDAIKAKNAWPIRYACSYIEENYPCYIKMEDVAKKVNLTPSYFSTLFKKEAGKNFSEYVTEVRMEKACDFLKNSDMNISEVAHAVGFSDLQHFSKSFKKAIGVKPTEFRKIYS